MVKEDEKLIIEDGVTVLEPLSFVDCKAKEIIMPDSVETIKHCAFKNCDNLKKIVFEIPGNSIYECIKFNVQICGCI